MYNKKLKNKKLYNNIKRNDYKNCGCMFYITIFSFFN